MKLHLKKVALCAIPLMLSACSFSSLSTMDCFSGNWKSIGYQDGLMGASKSKFNDYQNTCSRVGVTPNYRQWEAGRREGLKYYCTLDNLKQLGGMSSNYNAVCPNQSFNPFSSSNDSSSGLSKLQRHINHERQKLQSYQERMDKLRQQVDAGIYTPQQAHAEMQHLEKKIEYYEAKINRHMRQLAQPLRSDDDD